MVDEGLDRKLFASRASATSAMLRDISSGKSRLARSPIRTAKGKKSVLVTQLKDDTEDDYDTDLETDGGTS